MPRLVEMGKIVTLCQQRVDLVGDENIDAAEWNSLVSEAYGELFGIVADSGMRYFEVAATLTTDGTNVLEEPDDHLSTIGLWWVQPSGERCIVRPLQAQELARWSARTGGHAERYELVDDKILLYPKPPIGQTYEMRFVQQAPDLTAFASDACVDLVCPEGQAFLVWNVAVKAKGKREEDVRLALSERDRYAAKLQEWAVYRSLIDPKPRYLAENDDDNGQFISPASWRHR